MAIFRCSTRVPIEVATDINEGVGAWSRRFSIQSFHFLPRLGVQHIPIIFHIAVRTWLVFVGLYTQNQRVSASFCIWGAVGGGAVYEVRIHSFANQIASGVVST